MNNTIAGSKLHYTKIGRSYQCVRDFVYPTGVKGYHVVCDQFTLIPDGRLLIKKYYAWDGPTGGWNTKTFVKSSCIHDVLCQMVNTGKLEQSLQPLIDKQMYLINQEEGMWKWRAAWTFLAVRLFQARKKYLTGKREVYIT